MPLRALALCAALLAACSPPPRAPRTDAPAVAAPAAAGEITVDNVTFGSRLTSPARITGKAPGTWYFEAVFQARLVAADGTVLAEVPAQAQSDWMTAAPVPFAAEFTFSVPADTKATLFLAEDMYGSEDHPDATRKLEIPVVLVAAR